MARLMLSDEFWSKLRIILPEAGHYISPTQDRRNAMVDTILSNSRACIKDDYQTAHEILCARLQQAHTIADLVATHDLTDGQMNRLIWALADILKAACSECENLTARDFEPVK